MKRNGFTLIELLAVIVILAIIALIATPIILGIINDAREKANERSVELYASAVRNAVAAYQLTHPNAPTNFSDLDIQYDGKVECTGEELYSDGSFYLEGCKVNNGEKEYSYGTKQEVTIEAGKLNSVCTPAEKQYFADSPLEAGYKYECKVDPNKEKYTFYVLNTPAEDATSVNLIMDSNININGNAVKGNESDLGLVSWHNSNSYGPITAMNYLKTATTNWTNVNTQKINKFTECESSYGPCVDKIMTEYITKARMPYLSEISEYSIDANNAYLYDNLNINCLNDEGVETSCDNAIEKSGVLEEGIEHIQGVGSYWLNSSNPIVLDMEEAWNVYDSGNIDDDSVGDECGVRPVINLSI